MKMNKTTINKAIVNELIVEMKRKKFDYFEKACMIDHLLKTYEKDKTIKGRTSDAVAKEIGVSRQDLYRIKSVLYANARTKKLMKNGIITGDKVSRILFNLKDICDQDYMIDKTIEKGLTSTDIEREVAERNNPQKIIDHMIRDIDKFNSFLDRYTMKVPKLSGTEKNELRTKIDKTIERLRIFLI